MTPEHRLQNEIRNALAGRGLFFRANVGTGWTGAVQQMPAKTVIITEARPFSTGLPKGFSDLFGITPVVITPEMVGQTVGVFTALEVKTDTGRVSKQQRAFLDAVIAAGGRAAVVRSVTDAVRALET